MNKSILIELIKGVKAEICTDCRAYEGEEIPGIQLTVACGDSLDEWGFQTGDNSYSGGAYPYPHWSVNGVYDDTDPAELADTIIGELNELRNS